MTSIRIQGIKYDEKSSFQSGSRLAPPLIREAFFCPSANLSAENSELVDVKILDDKGDFEVGEYFVPVLYDLVGVVDYHVHVLCMIFM